MTGFSLVLASLAILSLFLSLWQWGAGRRFPLHQRDPRPPAGPPVTILKPLKGADPAMADCLRSWLDQDYPAPTQFLFGVAASDDPAFGVVERLLKEYPHRDARLVLTPDTLGWNGKVSNLTQLLRLARHELVVITDSDVWAPADFLVQAAPLLEQEETGLVHSFYALAPPQTAAMRWEAVAVNADFWSQVLQNQTLKDIDFALGAAMLTTRSQLEAIGGLETLADFLADDYQLGHRIARKGKRIVLSPIVVECRSAPMGWREVWRHQLRWARTIRVCQPLPYFFSILSNATLWPLAWCLGQPTSPVFLTAVFCWAVRYLCARDLQQRLTRQPLPWSLAFWVFPKDLLALAAWAAAFVGNQIIWRGQRFQVTRDGRLKPSP